MPSKPRMKLNFVCRTSPTGMSNSVKIGHNEFGMKNFLKKEHSYLVFEYSDMILTMSK